MSDKLNNYKALLQTEYQKLKDIYEIIKKINIGDPNSVDIFWCTYLSLDKIRKEFYDHHNTVIILISGDDTAFDSEDNTRKRFDLMLYECQACYFKLPPLPSPSTAQSTAPSKYLSNYKPRFDVNVPTFKGDIAAFQSFIDIFDALVHNDQNIPKILKFSVLKSHVQGPALQFIHHLSLADDNYDIAYATLCQRFKNTHLLASNLWNNLDNAPMVQGYNHTELRNLLDWFTENLAALKNVGLPTEYWDFILVQMILNRLPLSIITRFELQYDD